MARGYNHANKPHGAAAEGIYIGMHSNHDIVPPYSLSSYQ
jgi:hypothetical protein